MTTQVTQNIRPQIADRITWKEAFEQNKVVVDHVTSKIMMPVGMLDDGTVVCVLFDSKDGKVQQIGMEFRLGEHYCPTLFSKIIASEKLALKVQVKS